MPRTEADQKVELREELQPMSLAVGEDLGGGKVFQVLVIGDHIHWSCRALEVVMPVAEGLKDRKEFLVMSVIIQLWRGHGVGVECNRSEFTIGACDGEDASNSIVRGISFNSERSIRDPMSKDRSRGKGLLQGIESGVTLIREWNNNVGIIMDEMTVEVGKSEEGLDVLHFTRFWPVLDSLDFLQRHGEAIGGQVVAQVFHGSRVELTLLRFHKETIALESE
ncbi:hypothetical protein SCLCIDRAFT_112672 [Scleroderma citrinum Foug A]|uniref:Uncharacterized protein n=1 Tax=Scleroderma citrinum Foug A TaxID=1036808 RepID=A0A0C3AKG6_9AGAM|nr:hypothetical protein SCLCIDRAFT_112672 [Scleroderma citrinum Foug A]